MWANVAGQWRWLAYAASFAIVFTVFTRIEILVGIFSWS